MKFYGKNSQEVPESKSVFFIGPTSERIVNQLFRFMWSDASQIIFRPISHLSMVLCARPKIFILFYCMPSEYQTFFFSHF